MANEQIEPLHTVAEVAARLRISVRTCGRLIASGDIRASQIGGQYRIAASELARIVAPGSRHRHEAKIDGLVNTTAEITAVLTRAQGCHDHGQLAAVFTAVRDRAEVARVYHAARAVDSPAPRPVCAPITEGADVAPLDAATMAGMKQLGAEVELTDLERRILHSPEDVVEALANATDEEIKAAIEAGRAHRASKASK